MTMRGLAQRPLVHLLDEVAQHLLADLEVGDDAVLQRPDGLDVRRRAADHALGLGADGERAAVAGVDGDDRRLVEHDAAAAARRRRVLAVPRSTAMSRPMIEEKTLSDIGAGLRQQRARSAGERYVGVGLCTPSGRDSVRPLLRGSQARRCNRIRNSRRSAQRRGTRGRSRGRRTRGRRCRAPGSRWSSWRGRPGSCRARRRRPWWRRRASGPARTCCRPGPRRPWRTPASG